MDADKDLKRKRMPFKSSPNTIKKYEPFSLKQLNLMWAALPMNNFNKDEIAKEIERRVDLRITASGKAIKKGMDTNTALDILGL